MRGWHARTLFELLTEQPAKRAQWRAYLEDQRQESQSASVARQETTPLARAETLAADNGGQRLYWCGILGYSVRGRYFTFASSSVDGNDASAISCLARRCSVGIVCPVGMIDIVQYTDLLQSSPRQ